MGLTGNCIGEWQSGTQALQGQSLAFPITKSKVGECLIFLLGSFKAIEKFAMFFSSW